PIFRLALGYYRGRSFADRVFADRGFADGPLTNWRSLDNWLRAATAVPTKANDAMPTIPNFSMRSPVAARDESRIDLIERS
ncbi:hypothetical protein, partial [Bradyrhizobium japonicum]|uniref:hypothetical protein n=1 Tax=Bradyrhizobium japonicum TaxID=375 RepID=UPI0030A2F27B